MTKKEQLQKISEEYLSAFLGFAIQKLGDFAEAEELAQEIAFQAVVAVRRGNVQKNFDAYLWSIAHNTFKRWCARKKSISLYGLPDAFSNIVSNEFPIIDEIISTEEASAVRLALSRLTSHYRKTMVHFFTTSCPSVKSATICLFRREW